MGFLNKAFRKVKKQIQPGNMIARDMGMKSDGIRSDPRKNVTRHVDYIPGRRPQKPQTLQELLASRPGLLSRAPQKRGGFGFGLGEAIRRLKEQRDMGMFKKRSMPRMEGSTDMGMPRMDFGDQIGYTRPNKDPSMPANPDGRVYAGGSPGLYAPGGRFNPGGGYRIMPNFGMEQMPIARRDPSALERLPMGEAPSFNPTIFGQQMGDMDFSQMPEISPVDMSNLQMPTLPREISQMDLPQMPEGLPSMQDVQGGRDLQQDFPTQRRMMMAEGDEVINRSPEQEIFSLQAQLENLEEQLRMDRSYNDDQAVIDTSAQMAAIQRRIQEILQESGRTISREDSQMGFKAAGSIGLDDQGNPVFPEYAGGGYVNGYAEGDEVMMMEGNEIESMLSGMDSGEEEAMGELEQMAPEMEMIDQLVNMVVQMIQQGASEEEVIMFLREQGLDDEDIGTVLQLVSEMAETEEAAAQNEIGADLEQLG